MVADGARAVEGCNAADHDLHARAGEGVGQMRFVAIRIGSAEFIQQIGREGGEQLEAGDVRAVAEVRRDIQRILAAHRRVERVFVAEVVIADERPDASD